MKQIEIGKTGERIPILGFGTWGISRFFKDQAYYEEWKESIRTAIELGMIHIDTAEMYGWGRAEEVLGEVIQEYDRDSLFITSKLFPIHFWKRTMRKAAKKSLARLGIDHFDLYLIHWPNALVSTKKQMKILEELVQEGKTRYIGVSNFSVEQFKEAQGYLKKEELVNNQLPANITNQKHIHESLPYYQKNNILMTAYSPLAHKGFTDLEGRPREKLEDLAKKYNASIQQIAIAWLINHDNVITIPKAFHTEHVKDNAKAADIQLTQQEIELFYT